MIDLAPEGNVVPLSVPKGPTREHVLGALADLDAGVEHPFRAPTRHGLAHEGRRYPPKAVVGLAYRHLAGRLLRPEEFGGGEAPGQANFVPPGTGLLRREEDRRDAIRCGRGRLGPRRGAA